MTIINAVMLTAGCLMCSVILARRDKKVRSIADVLKDPFGEARCLVQKMINKTIQQHTCEHKHRTYERQVGDHFILSTCVSCGTKEEIWNMHDKPKHVQLSILMSGILIVRDLQNTIVPNDFTKAEISMLKTVGVEI